MAAVLVFVVFLVAIAISLPIGVSMILGSVAPIFLLDRGGNLAQLLHNTFSGANNTPILAVPLFILGGVIMAEGGISKKLFNFFAYFVGRIPGGVPCAVILTCLFYGAISGSGPAIIILAPVLLPAVKQLGIDGVHFGVVLVCCLSIGLATPPFGLDLFVAGNLSEEPPMAVAKRAIPFIVSFLIALALITYVPWFSTFLVNL